MEQVILFIIGLSFLACLAYLITITLYCYGWLRTQTPTVNSVFNTTSISVIIAARNEEDNIAQCLTVIVNQSYPTEYLEIIVVDDASEDTTNNRITTLSKKHHNIKLISLKNGGTGLGKKNAIKAAIKESKGELIVTTDADCMMGKNWLKTISSFYQQTNAKMIVAPVCFYAEKTFFEKMQSLEFMALVFSGGASLYFDKAIMANGANLAYTKAVFNDVNGFEDIDQQASGDDVLLMYKIEKKHPKKVLFLKHAEAIVYTKAQASLKGFINQRKRWSSKPFNVLNNETKAVSIIVYLYNTLILLTGVLGVFFSKDFIFHLSLIELCLILFTIKCFIDFLLLFLATSFFRKKSLMAYFLGEQVLYIIYVFVIGILGTSGKYEWKGRKSR